MKFTQEQKAILIGMILGDAYVQKTGEKNARLRLEHGADQKKYLFWKTRAFPKLFQGKPQYLERKHPLTGRVYTYWRHQSNSTPELGKWRKLFYDHEGKKHIPRELSQLLRDPQSLAVWYMDDGYYYKRDKVSYIYLGKVGRQEARIAQDAITRNFGIVSTVKDKKRKGFVLYFSPQETLRLHRVIKAFLLPLFHYKLSS